MNEKQFSLALGEVDDKYVTEALTYQGDNQAVEHKSYSVLKKIQIPFKRIVAAIVIVIVMFTSVMSVTAIRGPFFEMVKTIFSDHVELEFRGDKKAVITEVYGIGNIPEDFELTKESINNSAVFKDYENPDGAIISFSQMITEHGTTVDVDNEHSKSQTVVVNGLEVYVVESLRDDITAAFWAADGYSFNLTYIGEIDVTLLSEMISSIQVVESRKE